MPGVPSPAEAAPEGRRVRQRPVAIAIALVAGLVTVTAIAGWRAFGGAAQDPTVPRLIDELGSAGVVHAYEGGFTYFVGGGVAAFDCDDDGRQDLYIAGGSAPAGLFLNESPVGGALRFRPLPAPETDLPEVTGAYPLDVDGDGITDLAVLRLGEDVVLRGLGGCQFERANESLGFDGANDWTASFSATWEGAAALPTFAIGGYIEVDENEDFTGTCLPNHLYRPDASGGRYAAPTRLEPSFCALSMLFSDWDRSGRRDLRISNDRHYYSSTGDGQEQLWRIAAGETPRLYGPSDGWRAVKIWGMGIASQDLTGDGYPEVYLTSQGDNKLQALADGPTRPMYEDIALARGATATRPFAGGEALPSTAWHAEFQDVNNDGHMDLFVAKGNVEAQPDFAARDPSNLLLGGADGTFAEAAEQAGVLTFAKGRGAALVDLNLDGLLDLVEVVRRENVKIWRNVGAGTAEAPAPLGNWLGIRLADPGRSNRDAIGAWVAVRVGDRVIEREVTVGGGHAGGQLGPVHFGLGAADGAEVRVTWPDGEVGPWLPVTTNRYVTVNRGATEVTP